VEVIKLEMTDRFKNANII